ncbi:MAG: hypothetical protein KTR14_05380 [Vampirovibrio sp.]|nr:hypothetical protein [Vampirovibrio sp.]
MLSSLRRSTDAMKGVDCPRCSKPLLDERKSCPYCGEDGHLAASQSAPKLSSKSSPAMDYPDEPLNETNSASPADMDDTPVQSPTELSLPPRLWDKMASDVRKPTKLDYPVKKKSSKPALAGRFENTERKSLLMSIVLPFLWMFLGAVGTVYATFSFANFQLFEAFVGYALSLMLVTGAFLISRSAKVMGKD